MITRCFPAVFHIFNNFFNRYAVNNFHDTFSPVNITWFEYSSGNSLKKSD